MFKRALLDLKLKGRIDTGDSVLNIFLGFFLNEDPKKVVLLVDNFLTVSQSIRRNEIVKLNFDSDEESQDLSDGQKSLGDQDKKKLLSLKLQSIDEVIKRSERIKRK